ncbi:MAG: VCBS repeat-containing protein, partial [Pseudomonadota bacterium]
MKISIQRIVASFLLFISLSSLFFSAHAALPNDGSVVLTISDGIGSCLTGGVYPSCDVVNLVNSGSYFRFTNAPNGRVVLKGDLGIILGVKQGYKGSLAERHIVKLWNHVKDGTNFSASAITADNNGGLDMRGWRALVTEAGYLNFSSGLTGLLSCWDLNSVIRLAGNCQIGDTYTLDYSAVTPVIPGNNGAFNGQPYILHLEGLIVERGEEILFNDVTAEAQLDTTSSTNVQINNHGGGLAWLDYNNDGWQDLYTVTRSKDSGRPNRLYRNNKNGTFTDITPINLQVMDSNSKSVAIGDFNNDGWDDIFIGTEGTNRLFKNNQDGSFIDVSNNGVNIWAQNSVSSSMADIDG